MCTSQDQIGYETSQTNFQEAPRERKALLHREREIISKSLQRCRTVAKQKKMARARQQSEMRNPSASERSNASDKVSKRKKGQKI